MPIKGNKGEWSEFYAFIKILTDGELFAADENLKIIKKKFFTVLKIIRDEGVGKKVYDISGGTDKVLITDGKGNNLGMVALAGIKNKVIAIFSEMKNSVSTTFQISLAEKAMKDLKCDQIKASSGKKADLILMLHDHITPTNPELGFSIKSMIGSPSTLLNASGATNFVYEILHANSKDSEDVNKIKGHSKVRDRAKQVNSSGGYLKFVGMDSAGFRKNLRKIDSNFHEILAEMLKCYFDGKGVKVPDLVNCLVENKNFCEKFDLDKNDLEFKIKNFLQDVALGMTPNKEWDGVTSAHGGYIIVKENGEVVCYHLYNRDEFKEYLYKNTKFDTPSTTRHKFGEIYKEDGKSKIKYNLQIRFLK